MKRERQLRKKEKKKPRRKRQEGRGRSRQKNYIYERNEIQIFDETFCKMRKGCCSGSLLRFFGALTS